MSRYYLLLLAGCCLCCLTPSLIAQTPGEGPAKAKKQPPLIIAKANASGEPDTDCLLALTAHHKFSFVPPTPFAMEVDASRKIVQFKNIGVNTTITVVFADDPASPFSEGALGEWLEEVKRKYSGVEVPEHPDLTAFDKKASAFDLTWTNGLDFRGRFARVPLDKGYLEVALMCPNEKFDSHLPAYVQLLLSFNVAGPKDVVKTPRFQKE